MSVQISGGPKPDFSLEGNDQVWNSILDSIFTKPEVPKNTPKNTPKRKDARKIHVPKKAPKPQSPPQESPHLMCMVEEYQAPFRTELKDALQYRMARMRIKPPSLIPIKTPLFVQNLETSAQHVYRQICRDCSTDDAILRILHLIHEGPSKTHKMSGRIIDSLVTKFHKFCNTTYYLDVTDPTKATYVSPQRFETLSKDTTRALVPFDIAASYHRQMVLYSKTYFDPFGRGVEVWHKLHSGMWVELSLCKFLFFKWADDFRVFEFLDENFDSIISVQRYQHRQGRNKTLTRKRRKPVHLPQPVTRNSSLVFGTQATQHKVPASCVVNTGSWERRRKRPKRERQPTLAQFQTCTNTDELFE